MAWIGKWEAVKSIYKRPEAQLVWLVSGIEHIPVCGLTCVLLTKDMLGEKRKRYTVVLIPSILEYYFI